MGVALVEPGFEIILDGNKHEEKLQSYFEKKKHHAPIQLE